MKTKRFFTQYKDLFLYSKNFLQVDPRMSYVISLYAANTVHKEYKTNPNALNEDEKALLQKEILNIKTIQITGDKPTIEEYNDFIENMFYNVDQEDREGEVTQTTARSFKMISDLIEVFNFFGSISSEWSEKRKYCKFKAIDIMGALKKGEVPKRGGPNDVKKEVSTKNQIDDEIKNLEIENDYEKRIIEENLKRQGKLILY